MAASSIRAVPEIFTDLVNQLAMLVRKEGELARTEAREKVGQITSAMIVLVAGAVILVPAMVILYASGVLALMAAGLTALWSTLIVGGAAALIGIIVLAIGAARLGTSSLAPERTIHGIRSDVEVARSTVRSGNDRQQAA